jgi:hypothetical protein
MLHPIRVQLPAIGLFLTLLAGCESPRTAPGSDARAKGRQAAEHDIAQGILKEKEYPPLPYSLQEIKYIKLIQTECGVEREVVQAASDSRRIREEVAGYNEVMHAEIRRRFGADILQKLRAKAEER